MPLSSLPSFEHDSTFEDIELNARQSPDDPSDDQVVSIELSSGLTGDEESRTSSYHLWYDPSIFARQRKASFSIIKTLPEFAYSDEVTIVLPVMNEDEKDFADFVNEQARAITPDDVAFLGRIANSIQIY